MKTKNQELKRSWIQFPLLSLFTVHHFVLILLLFVQTSFGIKDQITYANSVSGIQRGFVQDIGGTYGSDRLFIADGEYRITESFETDPDLSNIGYVDHPVVVKSENPLGAHIIVPPGMSAFIIRNSYYHFEDLKITFEGTPEDDEVAAFFIKSKNENSILSGIVIKNCVINWAGAHGILVGMSDTLTLTGNTITGTLKNGIKLAGVNFGTISGNQISNSAQSGILVDNGSQDLIIENNVLKKGMGTYPAIMCGGLGDINWMRDPNGIQSLNNIFRNNLLIDFPGGGVVFKASKGCGLVNNTIMHSGQRNGAASFFPLKVLDGCSQITIKNNLIAGNNSGVAMSVFFDAKDIEEDYNLFFNHGGEGAVNPFVGHSAGTNDLFVNPGVYDPNGSEPAILTVPRLLKTFW